MNLRIKPSLRDTVLKQHHDFNWLVDENYSVALKSVDSRWADTHVNAQQLERLEFETQMGLSSANESPWIVYSDLNLIRLSAFKFYPGFYKPEIFASYQVGTPQKQWGKDRGFTFKIFFEFKDPQTDLTPNVYKEFSRKLSETNFDGDSKVPMLPGWIRFTWNNVIIHATSIESAKIAEKIGLEFFGSRLQGYSRGVDVRDPLNHAKVSDWPHFLCEQDPAGLPTDVSDFVQNK